MLIDLSDSFLMSVDPDTGAHLDSATGIPLNSLDMSQVVLRWGGTAQFDAWDLAGRPMHRIDEFFANVPTNQQRVLTSATLNPAPEQAPSEREPTSRNWLDAIIEPSESALVPRPVTFSSLTPWNAPTLSTVVTNDIVGDGEPGAYGIMSPLGLIVAAALAYWLLD